MCVLFTDISDYPSTIPTLAQQREATTTHNIAAICCRKYVLRIPISVGGSRSYICFAFVSFLTRGQVSARPSTDTDYVMLLVNSHHEEGPNVSGLMLFLFCPFTFALHPSYIHLFLLQTQRLVVLVW